MDENDTRYDVARMYKNSIPILIGLSFLTYKYDMSFLSQVYFGTAMYFAFLIRLGEGSLTTRYG